MKWRYFSSDTSDNVGYFLSCYQTKNDRYNEAVYEYFAENWNWKINQIYFKKIPKLLIKFRDFCSHMKKLNSFKIDLFWKPLVYFLYIAKELLFSDRFCSWCHKIISISAQLFANIFFL
jgi:hypothetical protein